MALSDEKYILLTTFKRDGTAVATAVWAVDLGQGKVGFWTSSGSGKAKRLTHTPDVKVQPCDVRGRAKAGTAPQRATARLVTGPELDAIRQKVVAKYGLMTKITKWLQKLGNLMKGKHIPYGDRGVVITPA